MKIKNVADKYSPDMISQMQETTQMLNDLKSSNRPAYDRLGENLHANGNESLSYLTRSIPNLTQGGPHSLKETMQKIIADPENTNKIVEQNWKPKPEIQEQPRAGGKPVELSANFHSAATPAAPASTPQAPQAKPADGQRFAPSAQTAAASAPGVVVSMSSANGGDPNAGFRAAGFKEPPIPGRPAGGLPENGLGGQGMNFMQALSALVEMFRGGHGSMQNMAGIFNRIGNDFQASTTVHTQGDPGLTQQFAGITKGNPTVVAVGNNGQERTLGPAQELRTGTAAQTPQNQQQIPSTAPPTMSA